MVGSHIVSGAFYRLCVVKGAAMSTTQWIITLVVTLIAGGAMGSVIGIITTNRRNRIQPIVVHQEIMPFVNRQIGGNASKAEILLNLDGQKSSFSDLILARITLENTGNKDYEEFKFGITISGLSLAVYLQTETQDRYHEISSSPQIDLTHLDNEIDFTLKPFNRKDAYSMVLFINPVGHDPVDIDFGTKHPVKFVKPPVYGPIASSFLAGVLEGLGESSVRLIKNINS